MVSDQGRGGSGFLERALQRSFYVEASWRASQLVRPNTRAEVAYCLQNQSRVLGGLRRIGLKVVVIPQHQLLSRIPCPDDLRGFPRQSW